MASDSAMETFSGLYMDLADPQPSSVRLDDVAHHLSQICRYTGAPSKPYSVAEHAYLVAQKLRADGHSRLVQLAGLHHDDAEAFIGDVSRPMKGLIPQVAELEARVFGAVVQGLGLEDVPFEDSAVKAADTWALAVESFQLLPSRGSGWFTEGLYDLEADSWVWRLGVGSRQAKRIWLEHHVMLCVECGLVGAAA